MEQIDQDFMLIDEKKGRTEREQIALISYPVNEYMIFNIIKRGD